eukprot:gene3584-3925_t
MDRERRRGRQSGRKCSTAATWHPQKAEVWEQRAQLRNFKIATSQTDSSLQRILAVQEKVLR